MNHFDDTTVGELEGTEGGDVTFPYGNNVATLPPVDGEILPNGNIFVDAFIALQLRDTIYKELGEACGNLVKLEHGWIRLGAHLLNFQAGEHWRELGYVTFEAFMDELKVKFNRGRTQLWSYLGVAGSLLHLIPENVLEEIGISKAQELKRALKKSGLKQLPTSLIEKAQKSEVTIKELRAAIGAELNVSTAPDPGAWFDLDGFYMTPEERVEWKEIVLVSRGLLNLKNDLPPHIARKEMILTWAREWFGTHAADFYGPVAPKGNNEATFIQRMVENDGNLDNVVP